MTPNARPNRIGPAVEIILCACATAGGALAWSVLFASAACLTPLLLTTAAGTAAAWLVSGRRSRTLQLVGSFLAVALVAASALTTANRPLLPLDAAAVGNLPGDVSDGLARVLAVSLPADVEPSLLVLPLVMCWTSAFCSVLLARWSTSRLAPVLPPLLNLFIALALVAERPLAHPLPVALGLSAVAALTAVRTHQGEPAPVARATGERSAAVRRSLIVAALIALATCASITTTLSTAWASPANRWAPRAHPPITVPQQLNPVAQVKAQLTTSSPRRLYTVRVDGAQTPPDRLRVAALEAYDGTAWTSTDMLRPAGHQLAPERAPAHGQAMRVTVTVADAKSPFLPVPGQPVSLSANTADAVFGFDSATGDLVLDSTPGPGLDYTVTGWVGPATVGVASGPVLHSSQGSVNTPSPQLPAALVSFAAHLTASTTSDPARLEALATELRRFPYSTQAPAGHSLGAIVRMLAGSAFADHLGYSEQHAAAFAVLARAMGFPARVAVGYLLHNSQDGVFTITEHDVHVWPEVLTRDGGWIAFEPTDTRQLLATSLDSAPPPPATGSTPPPPPKQPQSKVEIVTAPVGKPLLTVRLLVIAIASLFAAAGIVAMGVVAIKSHRRRRRHRATPPMAAVIGAWRETTDRLVERGLPLTPATTPSEVAALVSERIPHAAGPLHALAELATTAIYGPGDGELRNAELAWRLERGVRLLLRTSVRGRLHSCVAMVDPRPLFPRNARHLPRQGCRVARGASRSRTWAQ